jgi:adenine-specific DNA-methyltransferase
MSDEAAKHAVKNALGDFAKKSLCDASIALLESLGYRSEKRLELKPNTPKTFLAQFADGRRLNPENALLDDWQTVDFLFQLTEDEIKSLGQGKFVFEGKGKYNNTVIESYLFFAIALKESEYTRTQLSGITREINKLFRMPAMLLFRHGDTLTLSIIPRRLHKRDESKDVLEKVTLIKDIRIADPHRAHIEILFDLSLAELHEQHHFTNWSELQAAWQKTLDSSELNKRFFQEIANWYFWASDHVKFPKPKDIKDAEAYKAQSLIRLITRLIFCWFVKEKGLLPDDLFNPVKLQALLKEGDKLATGKHTVYYKAILQNLFFATLNREMNTPDKPDNRKFRGRTKQKNGRDQHHMIHNVYRYEDAFQDSKKALQVFSDIPFLNGGLFECLDKTVGPKEKPEYIRIDGFSDRDDNPLAVPDFLFFGDEREVDLSAAYGEARFKRAKVRGLIRTFYQYKFTITENTPIEEEIALDPELAGKVFENLLAAYNPETSTTARKQTGSFFTPREIVNYMVDEALIAYLETKFQSAIPNPQSAFEPRLRHLFAYNDQPHQFTPQEVDALIVAIDSLKSLDPAVGSGAFPMGILHKLVFILGKLDPRNEKWKERQIARVRDAMGAAEKIEDGTVRERAVRELEQQITGINEAFEHNELDYGRKLYLIENCIYGVDIQPIAVQIAKMRFFISLIVDQKIDDTQPNRGVRPLPNLETKFVAANTLIGVNRPGQQLLRNLEIDAKEAELRRVRERHFLARTPKQKAKCRDDDVRLRTEIAELLKGDGWDTATARKLASWNPYDQNASADFYDSEWMFGITCPSGKPA